MLTQNQAEAEANRIEDLRKRADVHREKAIELQDEAFEAQKALKKACPHPADMIEGGMFMNECRLCGEHD
jgi:hypothetical protein